MITSWKGQLLSYKIAGCCVACALMCVACSVVVRWMITAKQRWWISVRERWENRTDGAQEGRRRWCNSWAGEPNMSKILVCSLYTRPWRQTMWLVMLPVSAQTCKLVMRCNDCCFSVGERLSHAVSLSWLSGFGSNWVTMISNCASPAAMSQKCLLWSKQTHTLTWWKWENEISLYAAIKHKHWTFLQNIIYCSFYIRCSLDKTASNQFIVFRIHLWPKNTFHTATDWQNCHIEC